MIRNIIEGKAIVYILASIIPLLTISIFAADLIFSISAIIFLIYLIKNSLRNIFKNIFFLIVITFYFICVISSLFSNDILFSLKSSLPFLRAILFIFLLSFIISHNQKSIDVFYNFFLITFSILILHGIFEYIYQYYELIVTKTIHLSNVRLTLFFSEERKVGSFLVRLFGLFLALHIIKKDKSKFQNIFFLILTFLSSIIILLSGERNSLFFMIMFLFICLILLDIKFKIKLTFVISIFVSFLILLSLNSNLSNRYIFDKNNKFNFSKDKIIIFTPQHTAHYKTAIKMFFDKPYLGHGPKMFRILCADKKYNSEVTNEKNEIFSGCSNHPHSTYLQLLAETGILGAFLFSTGFLYIVYKLTKHFFIILINRKKNLSDYQIILSATVLITFWPFSPAGNFFNNWLLIVYSLPLGFYVNEFFEKKDEKN